MAEARRSGMWPVVVLVVLVLLGGAAFLLWQQYALSPQYAALKAVQAISDRDWAAFTTWVDVPAVVEAGIAAETSGSPGGALLSRIPGGRGALVSVAEESLQRRVEEGIAQVPPNVPFLVLFASGAVRGASTVGADAYVTAETRSEGGPIRLDLRLRREAGKWRVVEVRNARELLEGGP